jgi:hypothetical protein
MTPNPSFHRTLRYKNHAAPLNSNITQTTLLSSYRKDLLVGGSEKKDMQPSG